MYCRPEWHRQVRTMNHFILFGQHFFMHTFPKLFSQRDSAAIYQQVFNARQQSFIHTVRNLNTTWSDTVVETT